MDTLMYAFCLQFRFEEETSECVIACTESAMRFCTPFLRRSLDTWAFTVRSWMPSVAPISLFDRPSTSISKTSFSRSVKVTPPAGKMRPGELLTRSMNMERTRRGAQTEPWLTIRIACTKSTAERRVADHTIEAGGRHCQRSESCSRQGGARRIRKYCRSPHRDTGGRHQSRDRR